MTVFNHVQLSVDTNNLTAEPFMLDGYHKLITASDRSIETEQIQEEGKPEISADEFKTALDEAHSILLEEQSKARILLSSPQEGIGADGVADKSLVDRFLLFFFDDGTPGVLDRCGHKIVDSESPIYEKAVQVALACKEASNKILLEAQRIKFEKDSEKNTEFLKKAREFYARQNQTEKWFDVDDKGMSELYGPWLKPKK